MCGCWYWGTLLRTCKGAKRPSKTGIERRATKFHVVFWVLSVLLDPFWVVTSHESKVILILAKTWQFSLRKFDAFFHYLNYHSTVTTCHTSVLWCLLSSDSSVEVHANLVIIYCIKTLGELRRFGGGRGLTYRHVNTRSFSVCLIRKHNQSRKGGDLGYIQTNGKVILTTKI